MIEIKLIFLISKIFITYLNELVSTNKTSCYDILGKTLNDPTIQTLSY